MKKSEAPDSVHRRGRAVDRGGLIERFRKVRERTEALARPLSPEDQQLQSTPSASPTKWHRAHTTWFFETFLLVPRGLPEYKSGYGYIYNSYYEAVGPRFSRPQRGLISRPSAAEVGAYRSAIDGRTIELIGSAAEGDLTDIALILELGMAHEEQHQELILTDILHALSLNPLAPAYRSPALVREHTALPSSVSPVGSPEGPARFVEHAGGVAEIGSDGTGFFFDNEGPRHRVFLEPFELATRLVTVGEWKAFVSAGGYDTASLWLAEGFDFVGREQIRAPLHGRLEGGAYVVFTLDGEREARDDEPISHLSYYEADALARFLGARLPTEAEWEVFAMKAAPSEGNLLDCDLTESALAPRPSGANAHGMPDQLFGDVWEWTSSGYDPYPGFEISPGALGEYNGKFMVNQKVLRGGSCLTPRGHVRASYRNFWHPDTRFQMSGLRLARSPAFARARSSHEDDGSPRVPSATNPSRRP